MRPTGMTYKLLLLWSIATTSFYAMAQNNHTVMLKGTVSDQSNGKRLEAVNVLLYADKGLKMTKFTTTGKEGTFSIQIPDSLIGKSYLQFSYMGYETLQRRTDGSNEWTVKLAAKEMEIREIIVKAPKVKAQGDTLIYDVRQFSKEGDRSIGDVLRRMPGIKTAENGQITYNGVPINRFYIENSDMLEGQYGLATHNLPNKEVGSVEILQNHQPIKALEGIAFSEQAAINLRLKEGAKHRWIGTLKLYAGIAPKEGLWNGQGAFMHFNKKHQNINTLKTNNTGQDTSHELNSFNRNTLRYRNRLLTEYIGITPPYSIGLNRERELMNHTYQMTTNHLFKPANGPDIKTSLTYQRHQEDAMKQTDYTYYESQEDGWNLYEQEESDYTKEQLSATVSTEINKPAYNLTEQFRIDMDWKSRDMNLNGGQTNQQHLNSNGKKAVNDLFLLKRKGNNFFTVSSYIVLNALPQRFNVQTKDAEVSQTINQKLLFTDNLCGWGFIAGRIVIDLNAGIAGMYKDMDSQLNNVGKDFDLSPTADMTLGHTKLSLTPKLSYTANDFQASLTLPAGYSNYRYETAGQKAAKHHYFSFSPSFYSSWKPSIRWEWFIQGGFSTQDINTRLFYPSDLLTTYRTIQRGLTEFCHTKVTTVNGGVKYNIPLKEYYSKLEIFQSWSAIPYTLVQNIKDGYIHSKYLPGERNIRQTSISGSISKGTDWAKTTGSLQAGWNKGSSYLLRNEKNIKNQLTSIHIEPEIDINPATWMNIRYTLTLDKEWMKVNETKKQESVCNLKQSLRIRLMPSERLNFSIKGEHYANQATGTDSHNFFLADVAFTYKLSKYVSLDGHIANLLNEKTYAYSSLSDEAMKINKWYNIRPRNILIGAYITF